MRTQEHGVVLWDGCLRWYAFFFAFFIIIIIVIIFTSRDSYSFPAGHQTKLMQNCGKATFKRTSIDKLMNTLVLLVSFFHILSQLNTMVWPSFHLLMFANIM